MIDYVVINICNCIYTSLTTTHTHLHLHPHIYQSAVCYFIKRSSSRCITGVKVFGYVTTPMVMFNRQKGVEVLQNAVLGLFPNIRFFDVLHDLVYNIRNVKTERRFLYETTIHRCICDNTCR